MLNIQMQKKDDGRDHVLINAHKLLRQEFEMLENFADKTLAGERVKKLVKNHIANYLGEGSSRGFISFIYGGVEKFLSLRDGEIYALNPAIDMGKIEPLSHEEWFDAREEILEQITSLKYY